jgi:predicted lipoprotein with Yx(FWY)xxD motif
MTRSKPISLVLAAAAIAVVAIVVAGCGGGGDDQATAASGNSNAAAGSATIGVSNIAGLGRILVDSKGRTVYLFEKDTGSKSTCSGACAAEWPPVTTNGKPSAGSGVSASLIGTTKRSDGKTQVTYNGHPVYLFQGDSQPGEAAGQNVDAFGAEWYVLSPAGHKLEGKAESSGGRYAY